MRVMKYFRPIPCIIMTPFIPISLLRKTHTHTHTKKGCLGEPLQKNKPVLTCSNYAITKGNGYTHSVMTLISGCRQTAWQKHRISQA